MWAKTKQPGFTIVELLVVIVVIGILAAITIVAYNGIQGRAQAAAVASALDQTNKKLALYLIDNSNYPLDLATVGIVNSGSTSYQYSVNNAATPPTYCVTATNGSTSYNANSANSAPLSGGCPGHGVGGVGAITNLMINPSLEGDAIAPNWAYFGSALSIDTTKASSGTRSLKTVSDSSSVAQGLVFAGQGVPAGAYSCSLYLASTPAAAVYVSARTESPYAEAIATKVFYLSTDFQRVSFSFTLNAAVGAIEIQTPLTSPIAGITIWGDAAMCVAGSTTPTYADGNSPNWVWQGLLNGSTSTGPAL